MAGRIELWTCPDTTQFAGAMRSYLETHTPDLLHKERIRVKEMPDGSTRSGLALRGFCATQFKPGYSAPVYDPALMEYVVRTSNGTLAENYDLW